VLIRPVYRSIDGGGLSGLACRSPGPARSIREKVADVHCGIGSCDVPRPSLAPYVTGTGATRGATATGGLLVLLILSSWLACVGCLDGPEVASAGSPATRRDRGSAPS